MSRTEAHAAKRVVLRGTVREVIDDLPDEGLDFAYLDGDHTLRGITIDLVSVFPKVRPGGWIGGDDFRPHLATRKRYEPTLVFPYAVYFAEAVGVRIYALPYRQFLLREEHHGLRVRRSHGPLRATRSPQPAQEGRVVAAARRQAEVARPRRVAKPGPRRT